MPTKIVPISLTTGDTLILSEPVRPFIASGIYELRCVVTDDFYVGASRHLYTRLKQHINGLNAHRNCRPALQTDWDNYGPRAFRFTILEQVPFDSWDSYAAEVALLTAEQRHLVARRPTYNSYAFLLRSKYRKE